MSGRFKSLLSPKIQTGCLLQLSFFLKNFLALKSRIKLHEGFRNKIYLDQLGHKTIGYGHLIKKSDKFLINKKYSKIFLNYIFEKDFEKARNDLEKYYEIKKLPKNTHGVLIEMVFQLGIVNFLKFKKFNYFVKKNKLYMASLEMLDSKWYKQTPKRVDRLIKILLS